MSEIRVNAVKNTSGVEQYLCKVWVKFNGTGVVNLQAGGGVSSVTDLGVGDYSVNFQSVPIYLLHYATIVSVEQPTNVTTPAGGQVRYLGQQTGYVRISTWAAASGGVSPVVADVQSVYAAIFYRE